MTIASMPAERRESRPASRQICDGTATLQDSLRSLQWSAASASRTTLQTSIAANTTSAVASPPTMTRPRREPGASPWRPADCRTEFVPNHGAKKSASRRSRRLVFVFALTASEVSDSKSEGRVEGAEPPSARTRAQRRGREPAGCALATMNSFDYSLVEEQDPSVGAFPGRHSWGPAPSEAAAGPRRAFTLVRVVLTRACLVHSGGPPCHV